MVVISETQDMVLKFSNQVLGVSGVLGLRQSVVKSRKDLWCPQNPSNLEKGDFLRKQKGQWKEFKRSKRRKMSDATRVF